MILHHLENSRSERIIWLLECLNLEYTIKKYSRDTKTSAAPETLKKIHPLGKAPILEDGDLIIAESAAILEYLCNEYDKDNVFRPINGQDKRDYIYWLHFAEGSLMPLMLMSLIFERINTQKMPFFAKPIARKISKTVKTAFILPRIMPMFSLIESHLGKFEWFAGNNFSAADIQMAFPLKLIYRVANVKDYKNISAYLDKINDRKDFKKAIELAK